MSLINEALKRAREAQQQAPPPLPRSLPLQPIEPAQQAARHGLGLGVLVGLAMLALLALFWVRHWAETLNAPRPRQANAQTAYPTRATLASPAPSTPAAARPAMPRPVTHPVPAKQPASPQTTVVAASSTPAPAPTAALTTATPTNAQPNVATNAMAAVAPPPHKPPPLRLQAIIFNPTRPSAMIGGKTLFVGDRVGDWRIIAIDQESATLAAAGHIKVLMLSE
jgi:hypothetical protein